MLVFTYISNTFGQQLQCCSKVFFVGGEAVFLGAKYCKNRLFPPTCGGVNGSKFVPKTPIFYERFSNF